MNKQWRGERITLASGAAAAAAAEEEEEEEEAVTRCATVCTT